MSEFNYNDQPLEVTQAAYKQSVEYLDSLPEVERYALFGAFRSDVSNIGVNATMLSDEGKLTDIGLWYLNRGGVGASPTTRSRSQSPSMIPGGVLQLAVSFIAVVVVLAFFND